MLKSKLSTSTTLRKKVFASFIVLVILLSVLLSLAFYFEYQYQLRQDVKERLHDIVAVAALQIDASAHNTLRNPEQEGNETYLRLRHDLQQIRDSTTGIRYVYTMVSGLNQNIMFILDAETNPDDIAHLGDLYDDASPLLKKNFATLKQPLVEEDFYTDKWGTWLTGYAPFYDKENNRAGIIGIDIEATNIITREHHLILSSLPLIITAILIILVLSWLIGKWLTDETSKALNALQDRERIYRALIETTKTGYHILDTKGRIVDANEEYVRLSGHRLRQEILGRKVTEWTADYDLERNAQEVVKCMKLGFSHELQLDYVHPDGKIIPIEINAKVVEFEDEIRILALCRDITERKRARRLIEHQATFDALTELPNRFLALDRLSQLINEAHRDTKQLAVLFLDLDNFKKINDTLGHDIGDKILIEAAERLRSSLRSGDTVARLGGDEFIVLLGGLDEPKNAQPITENLLNHFRDPFIIDNRSLILTISIGIAVYPDDGDNSLELLRNADSAMYHSKGSGRNAYSYFTDEMNQQVSRNLILEEQMHKALERGEFRICYQPQIDMSNRHISGFEALLRWNNPVLGEVSPEEFIVIAEQTGQIIPIGQYVLTEALTMAAIWQSKSKQTFTIAVNISPRQFRDPNLVEFIEQAIDKSGISSKVLELEITEGVLMSGHALIDKALLDLNKLGVSLAMDDFGTGYSSLSYLRTYPFNVIKIDRSFINDITVDSTDRELVNAAIAMAHSLGLDVVAEGVETEEQFEHLVSKGCNFAQGYLFSKAISPEEITKMIKKEW